MDIQVAELFEDRTFLKGGISSRTIYRDHAGKMVLFLFDKGQQLSEHTASVPAVMHFLEGRAEVKVGKQEVKAKPGTWVRMEAGVSHAIEAKTRLIMLLTLFHAPTAS